MDITDKNNLINKQVITETGNFLGRVRRVVFDSKSDQASSLVIASVTTVWIPEQLIGTYELFVNEIVSMGTERLIVFEGAEERLNQLTVGIGERFGISKPRFQRDKQEDHIRPTGWSNASVTSGDWEKEENWEQARDFLDDEENDDYSGGVAPTPRPKRPPPSPINDETAELPPTS